MTWKTNFILCFLFSFETKVKEIYWYILDEIMYVHFLSIYLLKYFFPMTGTELLRYFIKDLMSSTMFLITSRIWLWSITTLIATWLWLQILLFLLKIDCPPETKYISHLQFLRAWITRLLSSIQAIVRILYICVLMFLGPFWSRFCIRTNQKMSILVILEFWSSIS